MNMISPVDKKTSIREEDKEKEVVYLQAHNVVSWNIHTAS